MSQCNVVKLLEHFLQLGAVLFQELAPRRNVVEQIFHHYVGAVGARCRFLFLHLRARHFDVGAQLVAVFAGAHLDRRNGHNRCHRLAAEAHCADVEQVGGRQDFRCGVALEAHPRVGCRHSAAIVDDLNERFAGVFHNHLNFGGARVDRVLNQLLNHRCRALHNFASRNLVGHVVG